MCKLETVPMPKKMIIGTMAVRFLSENRRKRMKIEISRRHSSHEVFGLKKFVKASRSFVF